jgi:alpha-amylase
MIKKYFLFITLCLLLFSCKEKEEPIVPQKPEPKGFQLPMASTDVMLQGFAWNSFSNSDLGGSTRWNSLISHTAEIGNTFDMIWLPPSSSAEMGGSRNMGYHPREWSNQSSSWGTQAELKNLISSFKANNTKVIADIVINHRGGCSTWNDFCTDNYGSNFTTFQLNYTHITKDDEAKANGYDVGENYDYNWDVTGDYSGKYASARDLDHSQEYVRSAIKEYLKFLHKEIGYDGWRYDLVKGYNPKYIKEYNDASGAYFSVGEYYQNNYDALVGWVKDTEKKSAVFDFECRRAIRQWNGGTNYSLLAQKDENGILRPSGVIRSAEMRQYAVTFIDNHDTAPPHSEANEYKGDVPKAYAFLLSSAGIPCVFWQHWLSHKSEIKQMIETRKKLGINSNSDVVVTSTTHYYEARAIGKNGELICRIGDFTDLDIETPNDFVLECFGEGWEYFSKTY